MEYIYKGRKLSSYTKEELIEEVIKLCKYIEEKRKHNHIRTERIIDLFSPSLSHEE